MANNSSSGQTRHLMQVPSFELEKDQIRQELDQIRHPFRVAVDRAKNAFNIGSIVRTAHSFLAKEILLVGSEPWYERAAMGMQKYENIIELSDSFTLVERAASSNWPLVVFEKEHARASLWQADMPEGAVLVFGSEDEGVHPAIVEAAHEIVSIPMYGINHSYPVSVAAGIGMAEWARRYYEQSRVLTPSAEPLL